MSHTEFKNTVRKISAAPGFRRYFTNTTYIFLEKIFRIISSLIIGIFLARYLGPEQFGMLNFAISLGALFSIFSLNGIEGVVIKRLIADPDSENQILGSTFILRLVTTVLVFPFLYLFVEQLSISLLEKYLIYWIAAGILFNSSEVIDFYFQSKVQSQFGSLARILQHLVSISLKIYFLVVHAPLINFAFVLFIEPVILFIGLSFIYKFKKHSFQSWKPHFHMMAGLMKESWPLILSSISIMIYMRIDQIMIRNILGSAEVGQYSAAVRISEGWFFLPVMIAGSLYPAILNAKKRSIEQYNRRMQNLYYLMVWIGLSVSIPILFLAIPLIRLTFGADYLDSAYVLMIHIWGGVFASLGIASSKWYLSEGRNRYSLFQTSTGALLNIIINIFLIPRWGIKGAAVATAISQIYSSYLSDSFTEVSRIVFYQKSKALFTLGIFDMKEIYKYYKAAN